MMSTEPAPSDRHAASAQAAALENTAGVRVCDDLRVVRVRGDDRTSWLGGQITNDVRTLQPDICLHSLALDVRGKILAELRVVDAGSELVLVLPERTETTLLASFERYIIMEDVTLERDPDARVVSVQGPRAAQVATHVLGAEGCVFAADELGRGGVFVLTTLAEAAALAGRLVREGAALGAQAVTADAFELARLRAGVPRFGVDYDEDNYPQEAGRKALLSFGKGCYLGQEVVCTLENRGRLHRRLCALVSDSGAGYARAGDALTAASGQAAGSVTSVVRDPDSQRWLALGYVKIAPATAGHALQSSGAAWTVRFALGEHESITSHT